MGRIGTWKKDALANGFELVDSYGCEVSEENIKDAHEVCIRCSHADCRAVRWTASLTNPSIRSVHAAGSYHSNKHISLAEVAKWTPSIGFAFLAAAALQQADGSATTDPPPTTVANVLPRSIVARQATVPIRSSLSFMVKSHILGGPDIKLWLKDVAAEKLYASADNGGAKNKKEIDKTFAASVVDALATLHGTRLGVNIIPSSLSEVLLEIILAKKEISDASLIPYLRLIPLCKDPWTWVERVTGIVLRAGSRIGVFVCCWSESYSVILEPVCTKEKSAFEGQLTALVRILNRHLGHEFTRRVSVPVRQMHMGVCPGDDGPAAILFLNRIFDHCKENGLKGTDPDWTEFSIAPKEGVPYSVEMASVRRDAFQTLNDLQAGMLTTDS